MNASATPMRGSATAPLVLTTGEPAGIGPDICVQIACEAARLGQADSIVLAGDRPMLMHRARLLGLDMDQLQQVQIHHTRTASAVIPGVLDTHNADYVLALLDHAIAGCLSGSYSGMVTAPLQKSVIAQTGRAFTGHTEYLAEQTGTPHVVMMLACASMRVALATTHLPLSQVPAAITRDSLTRTLTILLTDLRERFALPQPRVMVTGLNPHAGESGHLGSEEIDTIEPVIRAFAAQGHAVSGPYPADTLFQPKYLNNTDAVLAMYHDQGLPVLKHASFGQGVNITLGLPFIRTSVDHGTALDLAGTGQADAGSLRIALDIARGMSLSAAHRLTSHK